MKSPPSALDEIRRFFRSAYSPNEGERHNSVNLLYRALMRHGVHPDDIEFSIGDSLIQMQRRMVERLRDENEALLRELNFLRRQVDPAVLRNAVKAGDVEYRWFELEDLIREKFCGVEQNDDLPSGWQAQVLDYFEISTSMLRRWRDGTEQIPVNFIEAVRDLPSKPITPRKRKKKKIDVGVEFPVREKVQASANGRKPAIPPFDWTEDRFYTAARLWVAANSIKYIAEQVGCNQDQLVQCIYNRPPKFALEYDFSTVDSMSWEEAWTIGGALYRKAKSWKPKILLQLGKYDHTKTDADQIGPETPLVDIDQQKLAEVRQQYRDFQLNELERDQVPKVKGSAGDLYQLIKMAGKDGTTIRDLGTSQNWNNKKKKDMSARLSELQRQLRIFRGPKKGTSAVFYAEEFQNFHPEEWEIARRMFM